MTLWTDFSISASHSCAILRVTLNNINEIFFSSSFVNTIMNIYIMMMNICIFCFVICITKSSNGITNLERLIPCLTLTQLSQGPSRVIFWTHYDGLNAQILHTRCLFHRFFYFWKIMFLKGFTIYGHISHPGNVTQIPQTNFCSPFSCYIHIHFGLICRAVLIWGKIWMDGWTTEVLVF